LAYIQGRNM